MLSSAFRTGPVVAVMQRVILAVCTERKTTYAPPDRVEVGANASTNRAWPDWTIFPGGGRPPVFPPQVVVAVKALACELHRNWHAAGTLALRIAAGGGLQVRAFVVAQGDVVRLRRGMVCPSTR